MTEANFWVMSLRYLFGRRHPSGWRLVHETGVRFPEDVHKILVAKFHGGYHAHIEKNKNEILAALAEMDIPVTSELAHLYLNYGPSCVCGWYDINELRNLGEWTDYAHNELQVEQKFLALTSIEGQGITLYDRQTGHIYNVEFGQFDMLRDGQIKPLTETVSDFVRWCDKGDVEEYGEIQEIAPISQGAHDFP